MLEDSDRSAAVDVRPELDVLGNFSVQHGVTHDHRCARVSGPLAAKCTPAFFYVFGGRRGVRTFIRNLIWAVADQGKWMLTNE
jgi:hypothetical protein